MNNKSDGGPAFPVIDHLTRERVVSAHPGMTMRDYFAAKAMPLAMQDYRYVTNSQSCAIADWSPSGCLSSVAERAYEMADAMIAARGDA